MPEAPCIPDIEVEMIRPDMADIPQACFPEGFSIRPMRLEEAPRWTEIQREADRVNHITDELFADQFGSDPAEIAQRCFLTVREDGLAVGAISAWHARGLRDDDSGRIHWFGIRPAFQGRGLARPTLSYAMARMAEWHPRAWLTTGTSRIKALKLYLDYGFVPLLHTARDREAWRLVLGVLPHPALGAALGLLVERSSEC